MGRGRSRLRISFIAPSPWGHRGVPCCRRRTTLLAALVVIQIGCASGLSSPQNELARLAGGGAEPQSTVYRLQAGDVVEIKFFYTPELNETATIGPDGKISLQLIGEVMAAGLTPQELRAGLREQYSGILVNPEANVAVRRFAGQKAYVGGEVGNPGVIAFDRQPSLLQALIQAGWPKRSAELRNVVIIRNGGNDAPSIFFVDVQRWFDEPPAMKDVLLEPFDVVYVPKSTIAKVNDFVEQYIDKVIPISRMLGFSFLYSLNKTPITP